MRALQIVVALALLSSLGPFQPSPALAAPNAAPCAAGTPVLGDFDGDQRPDAAIRAQRSDGPAFLVHLTGTTGPVWVPGTALAAFDLNGDVCSDAVLTDGADPVVRAVPGTSGGLDVTGALPVPIPQADGLTPGDTLRVTGLGLHHHGFVQVVVAGTRVHAGVESEPFINVSWRQSTGEFGAPFTFGRELLADADPATFATGESFAGSGGTVVIGSAGASVKGHKAAGRIYLIFPMPEDASALWFETMTQADMEGGRPEAGDRFGEAVAIRGRWIAVGAPGEDIGSDASAGMVSPLYFDAARLYWRSYRAIHQDVAGVPGSNEDGDRFGSSLAIARGLTGDDSYDIVIGSHEAVGARKDAGSVTVAHVTKARFRGITQSTSGVPGSPDSGDRFGTVGLLHTSATLDTVLVGAPGEDGSACVDCGSAIRSDGRRLSSDTRWTVLVGPASDGIGWGGAFAR